MSRGKEEKGRNIGERQVTRRKKINGGGMEKERWKGREKKRGKITHLD